MKKYTVQLEDGRNAIILEHTNKHVPQRETPEGTRWNYIRLDDGTIAITGDAADRFRHLETIAEKEEHLWPCDPLRNYPCKKTGCFTKGGPCHFTTNEKYKAQWIDGEEQK